MASRATEVSLVIKARNEADRAIQSVTNALNGLYTSTEAGEKKVVGLTTALAAVDKAVGAINAATDRGEAAFGGLTARITENRRELEALKAQAASAAAALDRLNGADAIVNAGRDQSGRIAQIKTLQNAYDDLQAKIAKLGGTISADENRINSSRSALQQLGSTAIAAGQAQQKLRADFDASAAAAERQEQQVRRLAAAQSTLSTIRTNTDATTGKSAAGSASVFVKTGPTSFEAKEAREAVVAQRELAAAADRVRAAMNPQRQIQKQFNDEIREAIRLRRAEVITTDELRGRITQLRSLSSRAQVDLKRNGGTGIGIFGLRPYEVTNLGYQVNDLITQIASGTSPMQAFAQQGGQILQILPQIGSRLVALATSPAFLALGTAFGALVIGIREFQKEAEAVRGFQRDLGLNVDGGVYDPTKLAASAKALEIYGASAEQATKALQTFIKSGVDPSALESFGRTATDLAEILGVEVADAAKTVAEAFTGNYDSIKKLDDEYNFLTAAQRERIRVLFDEGKSQEALTEAYEIFSAKASETANNSRGPWASAFRELGAAWREFTAWLADTTAIKAAGRALEGLARLVRIAIRSFRDVEDASEIATKIAQKTAEITRLEGEVAAGRASNATLLNARRQLEYYQQQQSALEKQQGTEEEIAKVRADQAERTGKANADLKRETDQLSKKETVEGAIAEARKKALEFVEKNFKLADEATKRSYVDLQVAQAREAAEKKIADQKKRAADEAERERKAAEKDLKDPTVQTRDLIMNKEGFRSSAYWDVNAYRVGYGSDTVTRPDGRVERVTASTSGITKDDALRDLDRRIDEFRKVIVEQIGAARFSSFSAQQQAALTSIAYNYGSLPSRILPAVRNGTQAEIGTAVRGLAGDNGGINAKRRNAEADLLEQQNLAIDADTERQRETAAEKKLEAQRKFNAELDAENQKRKENIVQGLREGDLKGEALINAQKQNFIEDAVSRERAKAAKEGVEYTLIQQKRTEALAAAEFEATRGTKARAAAQKEAATDPVEKLGTLRSNLMAQQEQAQNVGDTNTAGRIAEQLAKVNEEYRQAIQNAITYWQTQNGPEAQAAIANLERLKGSIGQSGREFLMTGRQINESLAGGIASAFDRFAQSVAEGKNVFKSLKDAFLQFAADFLRQIAQMIIKQAIFNAIGGGTGSGGAGGGIAGIIGGLFHQGGVVGYGGGSQRAADPAWFANAVRYHTGGVAGLAPNEVPAVLQKGEEVLTRADPRHRMNGGMAGGGETAIKNVVLFDSARAAEELLRTPAGEKALLTIVSDNPAAFRAAMGQ